MECTSDDENQRDVQLFIKLTKLIVKQQQEINLIRNQLHYILLKMIEMKTTLNFFFNLS